MRKTIITLVSALAISSIFAQNRQTRPNLLESNTIYSSQISKDFRLSSGKDAFYIKNNQTPTRGGSNEGFVIYSTSDKANPIIGYSDKGHFDPNNVPSNVLEFLKGFVKETEFFETHMAPEKQPVLTRAYSFPSEVAPFVTTQWGQTEPYNWKCPIYSADKTITGCNATAMAQAMRVFQYPTNGTGSFSYSSRSFSIPVSANLADYPFLWDQMLDTYIPDKYTSDNGNAVANLLFACGASIEMDYGLDGSSSDTRDAMVSLNKNFGYDNDILYINRSNYTAKEWDEIIKKDLIQGYPVIYSGTSIYGGHAFIIDGYQIREDDSYFHVNWGWEGYCDGYFRLAFLSPLPDEVYDQGNSAIIHIHPEDGLDELTGYLDAQSIEASPTSFAPTDPKQISITIKKCTNPSANTYSGSLKIYLVSDEKEYEVGTIPGLNGLPTGYYYTSLNRTFDLPEVPVGSYLLQVRSIADASSYEVIVPSGNGQQTIVVSNEDENPIVKYTISYYIDDELYSTEEVEYNKAFTLPTNPIKEGYTFSGWNGYPTDLIMPDHDIRIDGSFTKNIILATAVTLNKENAELHVGGTVQLTAEVVPADTDDKSVVWSSSDENIATVNQEGLVTAVALGSVTITATTTDGSEKSAACSITVSPILIESISLNHESYSLNKGESVQLTATVTPENATNKEIIWTTSDAKIVTVDETGKVTFTGFGSATVTATAKDGSATASCAFTNNETLYKLSFFVDNELITTSNLAEGATIVLPDNPTKEGYTFSGWSGYPTDLIMPDSDLRIDGTFTKNGIKVMTIELNYETYTLDLGESVQLIATVGPEDATNNSVIWTSSDESVISVDENGIVTHVGVGSATITATAADDSGISANCVFTSINSIPAIIDNSGNEIKAYSIGGSLTDVNHGGVFILNGKDQTSKKILIK